MSVISKYRPISLTENLRKIYERLLLPTLTQALEPLHIFQGGFRKYRETLDQIAFLQETIISHKQRTGKYGLLCFLDIKAAHDSVDRKILFLKLRKKNVCRGMLNAIFSLFELNQLLSSLKIREALHSETMLASFREASLARSSTACH